MSVFSHEQSDRHIEKENATVPIGEGGGVKKINCDSIIWQITNIIV